MNRRQTLQRLAPLAGLALLGASMGLSGCTGWKISAYPPDFDFISIYIESAESKVNLKSDRTTKFGSKDRPYRGLVLKLSNELEFRHKRNVVDRPIDAEVVLKIKRIQKMKNATAFSRAGQLRQFELTMEVDLTIENSIGQILAPELNLQVTRTLGTLDSTKLATSNEEASQLASMEVFLVQQIIRQLAALRNAPPSTRPQTP